MPHARDILDVIVLPADPDAPLDLAGLRVLLDRWQEQGSLAPGTGPLRRTAGPRAWALLAGGFGTLWVDQPTHPTLYANQLGGFRVRCPACGAAMARSFGQAVRAWRQAGAPVDGDARTVSCPACGVRHPLDEVPLHPPGGFARGAVIFSDAASIEPSGTALRDLRDVLGGVRVVLRRRGS